MMRFLILFIALRFAQSEKIYAGTYQQGVMISLDGGQTWTTKNTTHGLGNNHVEALFASSGKLYVATSSGLSISEDEGNTWTTRNAANGLENDHLETIFVSDGKIYIGTAEEGGFSISSDGGRTWVNKKTKDGLGHNNVRAVLALGNTIYVGTDNGLSISDDGGRTWTRAARFNQPTKSDRSGSSGSQWPTKSMRPLELVSIFLTTLAQLGANRLNWAINASNQCSPLGALQKCTSVPGKDCTSPKIVAATGP